MNIKKHYNINQVFTYQPDRYNGYEPGYYWGCCPQDVETKKVLLFGFFDNQIIKQPTMNDIQLKNIEL